MDSSTEPEPSGSMPSSHSARKKPPEPTLPSPAFSFKDASMDVILEDLSSRFILNLPDEELSQVERVCFSVEQAHWYYEDFIRNVNPSLPSMQLRSFSAKLFEACPLLQRWSHIHEQAFAEFVKYKTGVPVCGALLLNSSWDKCVLVKGWKSSAPWGFPRGKMNENEPEQVCAVREVLEETGYSCEGQMLEDACISLVGKEGQVVTLFIVPNVPEDFPFNTRTRKEISKIEWFYLSQLPGWGPDNDDRNRQHKGTSQDNQTIKTWSVSPFLIQLRHKLYHFQVAFGYMPSGLNSRQIKEYRKAKRNAAKATSRSNSRGSHPRSNGTGATPTNASTSEAAIDEESTGAEGDEELDPETETDVDRSLPNSANGPSTVLDRSESSAGYPTRAPSAVDALFRRTLLTDAAENSSPDMQAIAPAKKATKPPKAVKSARPRIVSETAASHHVQAEASAAVRAQSDSPVNAYLRLGVHEEEAPLESQPVQMVGSSSGLPTPADSPITAAAGQQSQGPETLPHGPNGHSVDGPPAPRSMFEYVSPFDALSLPKTKAKQKQPTVKPTVTILKRPSATSTAQPNSGPAQLTGPPSSQAGSQMQNLRSRADFVPQSSPEDEELRVVASEPRSSKVVPNVAIPEAPSSLSLPTAGGMLSSISTDTIRPIGHHFNGLPVSESIAQMTPKAKVHHTMPDPPPLPPLDGRPAFNARSMSTSSSSSAQHLALLDQVANEAERISLSNSTCPTPQPSRSGIRLPPVSELPGWKGAPPMPLHDTQLRSMAPVVHPSNVEQPPVNPFQQLFGKPISNTQPPFANPPPPNLPYSQPPIGYGPSPTQPLPPVHRVTIPPPHLHHPHPHLHPQQHISIPSASPSPHLMQPGPQEPKQSAGLHAYAPMGPPNSMMAPPGFPHTSQLQGNGLPNQQFGSPRMPMRAASLQYPSPLTAGQHAAKPSLGGVQSLTSSTSWPQSPSTANVAGYPYASNVVLGAVTSPTRSTSGRTSIPPPNPNSFVVQKSQADRNELLNLIRSRSPPKPVANTPLASSASLPAIQTFNDGLTTAASPNRTGLPASILESGLIPANVQFRALTRRSTNASVTSPVKS